MKKLATAFAITLIATTAAQARGHRHHHHHRHYMNIRYDGPVHARGSNVAAARARGLPWCGAFAADYFGLPRNYHGLNLWQAREWRGVGHPSSPHIGAIAVWPHHVGIIVAGGPGHWVIESGNDGHAVRRRERSIAGASIRSFS